ncbi:MULTISPECIES: MOSC domain-containing protein [unclassified Sinorhizobium]|uniref:MOSC domain-containing protein n=1 Tax=unclassified Sinorhizobium TaxID=2613772 RepID=UPI0035240E76
MKILAVCIGSPEKLPGKTYKTGINKHAVKGAVIVDAEGLVGDAICNRRHHGGVDQAVYLEGSLTLDWWSRELGYRIEPGTFGENLVIEGLDNRDIAVGDRFIAGDIVLEATSPRIPCATLAARMRNSRFPELYVRAARPGIYCRIIRGGTIEAEMPVEHVPFTGARVGIPEVMATLGRKLCEADRARHLAVPLHHKLRKLLETRA